MDAKTRADQNVAAAVEVEVDQRRRGAVRVHLTRRPFDKRDELSPELVTHTFAIDAQGSDYFSYFASETLMAEAQSRAREADIVFHPRERLRSPARIIDEGLRSGYGLMHAVFKDNRTCLVGSTTWPDEDGMWAVITGPTRPGPQALYPSAVLGVLQWQRRRDPTADRSLLRTPLPERISLYEEGKRTKLAMGSVPYPLPPLRPRSTPARDR